MHPETTEPRGARGSMAFVCCSACHRLFAVRQGGRASIGPRCPCGGDLVEAEPPDGVHELTSVDLRSGPGEPEGAAGTEDLGYGESHGYGPAHGGPTGPGDEPAPVDLPEDEPERA